jgi:hypothetical protein
MGGSIQDEAEMRRHHSNRSAAVALASIVLTAAGARAQTDDQPGGVIVAPAPPEVAAPPPKPNAVPLDENTARMIGRGRFKLGVLAFEYSPVEFFSFGTDPPAWALRAVARVLVPNLHARANFVNTPRLLVTGQVAGFWADMTNDTAKGSLLVIPATLYVSVQVTPPLWLHLEGAYNWARGFGSGDVSRTDVDGSVVMRTAQVGAMAEFRLSRVVALIARGRYQPYATSIVFQGTGSLDAFTQAEASLEIRPREPHPIMGVGGVALTWKHVGVVAGAGYGNYFLPGMNVADPHVRVVPEASVWALF